MNVQIGKDKNNEFSLHNVPKKSLSYLNAKFQIGRENYGPTPTQIMQKYS